MHKFTLALLFLVQVVAQTPASSRPLVEVNGPYFGHRPPGAEPEVFNLPKNIYWMSTQTIEELRQRTMSAGRKTLAGPAAHP
jgi:hypothetical protein